MKNNQKKFIESAKPFKEGLEFRAIYIINSEKDYNGFWEENGYRQIIVIGETLDNELYKIEGSQYDVLEIEQNSYINYAKWLRFEIHHNDDCLHMWVDRPYMIKCKNNTISCLTLEIIKNE